MEADSTEQEPTIPDDDSEGRERQEDLALAILTDAGADFVEELTHPLGPLEPDDEGGAE